MVTLGQGCPILVGLSRHSKAACIGAESFLMLNERCSPQLEPPRCASTLTVNGLPNRGETNKS